MKLPIRSVLSLFDGMSCGQIALNRAGITYDKYFASEINKHAIKVTQNNYPGTIQVGDVTQLRGEDFFDIDLLIAGSPCQGFSFSGKQLNFSDPRSKLFFEFVRLIKECSPKRWMLENVVMKREFEQVITDILGVDPVKINSSLVSAQNRQRLYWANFPIEQPVDKKIILADILNVNDSIPSDGAIGQMLNKGSIIGRRLNDKGKRDDYNKEIPIIQYLEVRDMNRDKSNCLTTVDKDNVLTSLPIGRHPDAFNRKLPFRYYSVEEYCKLQTVPIDYFKGICSDSQAREMIGNAWTVDVIAHIFSGM